MHKKLVRQAGTTVSERELWDQSVQCRLLIPLRAIVLHRGNKGVLCYNSNKRTVQSGTIAVQDKGVVV